MLLIYQWSRRWRGRRGREGGFFFFYYWRRSPDCVVCGLYFRLKKRKLPSSCRLPWALQYTRTLGWMLSTASAAEPYKSLADTVTSSFSIPSLSLSAATTSTNSSSSSSTTTNTPPTYDDVGDWLGRGPRRARSRSSEVDNGQRRRGVRVGGGEEEETIGELGCLNQTGSLETSQASSPPSRSASCLLATRMLIIISQQPTWYPTGMMEGIV